MSSSPISVAVIGYGYWGPNLARNIAKTPGCRLAMICDALPEALARAGAAYPGVTLAADAAAAMTSDAVDAVAISTPVSSHFALAKQALEAGKHVLVEKPLTATVAEAETLVALAAERGLKLAVDHTFLFTGAVQKLKELVDSGELGDLLYVDSVRVNLGLFQHDVNVISDLAPHDLSILNFLHPAPPVAISATGHAHFGGTHENLAYVTLYYADDMIAHLSLNWLSPVKIRRTIVGGSRRMVVWDDMNADEKLKVYDKGVDVGSRGELYDLMVNYRSGDMWSPRVEVTEALSLEFCHFRDCIRTGDELINSGEMGLQVVRTLAAANESLRRNGARIEL